MNVFERLEQGVEFGLGNRAFARYEAGKFYLFAGRKTVPDDQGLPLGWSAPVEIEIGYAEPVSEIGSKTDMPDFQQGALLRLAKGEARVMCRSVISGGALIFFARLGKGFF